MPNSSSLPTTENAELLQQSKADVHRSSALSITHILLLAIAIRCQFAILLADPRMRPCYWPFGCHLPYCHITCHLLPVGYSPRAFYYLPSSLAAICHVISFQLVLPFIRCYFIYPPEPFFATCRQLITVCTPAIGIWPRCHLALPFIKFREHLMSGE